MPKQIVSVWRSIQKLLVFDNIHGVWCLIKVKIFNNKNMHITLFLKVLLQRRHCFKLLAVGDKTIWGWIHKFVFFQHTALLKYTISCSVPRGPSVPWDPIADILTSSLKGAVCPWLCYMSVALSTAQPLLKWKLEKFRSDSILLWETQ